MYCTSLLLFELCKIHGRPPEVCTWTFCCGSAWHLFQVNLVVKVQDGSGWYWKSFVALWGFQLGHVDHQVIFVCFCCWQYREQASASKGLDAPVARLSIFIPLGLFAPKLQVSFKKHKIKYWWGPDIKLLTIQVLFFFAKMIKCSSWNSGFSDIGSMPCCNPGNRSGRRSGADPCVQADCAASEIGQFHALLIEVTHVATWNAKYLDNVAASWGWPDLESQPVPLCDLAAYEFAIHWSLRDHFVDSGCQAFLLFSNSAMFDTNNSSRNSSHLPDESQGHPRRLYVGTTKSCVILRNLKGLEYFMMLDICPFLESEVCTIFVL